MMTKQEKTLTTLCVKRSKRKEKQKGFADAREDFLSHIDRLKRLFREAKHEIAIENRKAWCREYARREDRKEIERLRYRKRYADPEFKAKENERSHRYYERRCAERKIAEQGNPD